MGDWGEDGFIRVQRGVGMCGIGSVMVVAKCENVAGPTDATITTEEPCDDVWNNCADLAEDSCYKSWVATDCPKSCGLCSGATPVASNTCFDLWTNCADLAEDSCYKSWVATDCTKSCGLCSGATPVASNTCYDLWSNCDEEWMCSDDYGHPDDCKKACGKC